jgi:hypothetical protein
MNGKCGRSNRIITGWMVWWVVRWRRRFRERVCSGRRHVAVVRSGRLCCRGMRGRGSDCDWEEQVRQRSARRSPQLIVWEDDDVYLPHHISSHVAAMKGHLWCKPSKVLSDYTGEIQKEAAAGRLHLSIVMTRHSCQKQNRRMISHHCCGRVFGRRFPGLRRPVRAAGVPLTGHSRVVLRCSGSG